MENSHFGSFAPGQPPAAVTINLQTSNLADANAPLGIQARGGFQFGNDALDNPTSDPSLIDPAYAVASITPQLFTLNKVYLGLEDETATGPNFPRQYRIEVDVATGQTITNLQISDLLPGNLQFVSVNGLTGGTENVGARVTPGTTTPGGTLSRTLNSVTGVAGVDATLTFTVFVPRVDNASAVIINATSGNDVAVLNNASTSGNWTPIDARDPITAVSINPAGTEHTLTAKSIATQKSVAIVTDVGAAGASPGDVLEYTIQVQVSDYFAFQNLVLADLFSDGQRFDPSFAPTLTWQEHGTTFAVQNFSTANYGVSQNFTGAVATPPNFTIDPAANDGTTTVTFALSSEMALRPLADGKLVGGAIPNGGTGGPVPPSNPPLPFGATTATIKFRTIIQDAFSDDFPSGNPSLNPRDVLTNDVTVSGDLLSVANVTTTTGQSEADDSAANVTIVNTTVSKSIYAINGSTTLPLSPTGAVLVRPGDTVTYRLQYTVPTGDVENLKLNDYLPLPIFDATQVTTFSAVVSAAAPPAGTAKWGPSETLRLVAGAPTPTVSSVAGNNLLTFTYPTSINDATNTPRTADILFTVTVGPQPFADGLFLTNQVQASENNTQQPATAVVSDAIVQVQVQEPAVELQKGIVGYNATGLALGGITFNAPGGATTFAGGPISNGTQLNAIGGSDLLAGQVDAGDDVRYAIVLQNSGRSDAYDVSFRDQIISPGYDLPSGGTDAARLTSINFALRRGDGSLLVAGADYTATLSAAGLLTVTMIDNYAAGNVSGETGQGALSRGFNANNATAITNGSNTLIATYDLTLTPGVLNDGATITNTATLTNFAGQDAGPDFTTTDQTDTARVRTLHPTLGKVLTGTEVTTGNNSNTQAVIGELATYTLTLTVPEGSVANASIADTLDAGLAFVDVVSVALSSGLTTSNVIGTGTAPGNVTVVGSGQNLTFNFGAITNTNTNNAAAETITIVYRAVVLNANTTPNNQAGTTLNNAAVFSGQYTDRPGGSATNYSVNQAVATTNVAVIEPTLNVVKSVTVGANPDAGDPVTYQIVISSAVGQPTAFELFFSDTIPPEIAGLSIASVTTAGFGATPAPVAGDFQIAGNLLNINPGGPRAGNIDLPGGATITITVTGALASSVQPNQTINNNATIRWTSLDGTTGGTLTPAANVNASSNDTILDNYAATSANAVIDIADPAPVKTIDATSEASTTAVGGVERVAIGEIVRYRLVWQIPEGTSTNLVVTDLLPVGMQFTNDGTATLAFVSTGGNITSSVGAIGTSPNIVGNETTLSGINPTFVIPAAQISGGAFGSGVDPIFTLGTVTNPDSDATQEFVVIEFNAQVLNIAANQRYNNVSGADSGAMDRSNQATFATSTSTQTSGNATVRITEPAITNVNKTASGTTFDAGDVVTYTVTFANVNSVDASTAFDVVMTDTLPAFLTGVTFGSATSTGTVTGLSGGAAGNVVTVNAASMAAGATITIQVTGIVATTATPNLTVSNTALTRWTSTDGANADERTGADGVGGALNDYASSQAVTFTVPQGAFAKQFVTTSEVSTTGSNVTIGETVTYALVVTLPEGTTPGLTVIDLLPPGLQYVSASVITTTAADTSGILTADFGGTAPAPAITGGASSGDDVTFTFGSISVNGDNNVANNRFLILITAQVLNVPGNVGVAPQTTLPNAASFDITGDGIAVFTTPNVPAVVVEPRLQITKAASDNTPDPGQVLTYTLTINHTASSTAIAYDVLLRDAIPTGITLNTGSIVVSGATIDSNASTGSLLDLKFTELALGGTITVTYTATVTTSTSIAGAALDNTAKIYWDTDAAEDTNVIRDGGADGAPDRDLGAGPGDEVFNVNTDPAQDTERVVVNTSTISGVVYRDLNANGSFGGADTGISSVTVALNGTDLNGNAINLTTTTNGAGAYSFTGLTPGAYTITETPPAGLTDALETVGTNFGGTKSDALDSDTINGVTIAAQSNTTGAGYNFGEVLPSSVAGAVYDDANNDGVRQGGEAGLATVPVRITGTDAFGQAVSTDAATDGGGDFIFDNAGAGLRPGTYTVVELAQPAGYLDGRETAGTSGGSTATNEQIGSFTLPTNTAATGYLFGELLPASLSGVAYVDADNDGLVDGGETLLGGVTITLSGTDDLGASVTQAATTDAVTGAYSFSNLRPGTYVLTETQPAGYLDGKETAGTQTGTVNNTFDSQTISAIPLTAGTSGTGNNFGELAAAALAGTVYRDLDNDGVIDAGETGVAGVTITLTGTDDRNNPVSTPLTTDGSGNYNFTGLRPGTYATAEDQPAGLLDGRDTLGTPGGSAANDSFTAIDLTSGTAGAANNFGELPPSALAGGVFIDVNNDGVRDAGEPAVSGATITLTGTDDLGNAVNVPTTTDASGNYSFLNLRPGTYTLTETQPAVLLDGIDTLGTPGGAPANDAFTFTLVENTDGTGNNFGELVPGTIAGFVYLDRNNDGVKGLNDKGLANVTVRLIGTDDLGAAVDRTTTTDVNGAFAFNDVRPGTYTLIETQARGFRDGRETAGPAGGDTTVNEVISGIVIGPGGTALDNLFGEQLIPPPPLEVPEEEERDEERPRPAPLPFAFDSFHNFAARMSAAPLPGVSSIDVWRPALLPITPIYSGAANPGATLVIDLYNANGIHIGSMTVMADAGGNWLANFGTATLRDTPSDVRITQINAPYSFGAGAGQNLRTYYAPAAINPGHFLSQRTADGLGDEPAPLLGGLDLANPIQLGPVKYGGEFLASEGVAAAD